MYKSRLKTSANPHLPICLDAPTLLGLADSLQASMSFLRMNKHSRNVEKNGWCDIIHNEVSEWFLIFERFLDALGDGE